MKCKETRTIFNLFEVYSCYSCVKYKKDEKIVIGDRDIFIYYIKAGCQDIDENDINNRRYILEEALSKKLKLFLKDAIISRMLKKKILVIWTDNETFEKELLNIMSLDEDVHIIM